MKLRFNTTSFSKKKAKRLFPTRGFRYIICVSGTNLKMTKWKLTFFVQIISSTFYKCLWDYFKWWQAHGFTFSMSFFWMKDTSTWENHCFCNNAHKDGLILSICLLTLVLRKWNGFYLLIRCHFQPRVTEDHDFSWVEWRHWVR